MILWRELTARRFESFYPQLHVRPVNPRSRTIRPYFPGYMFLHLPAEQVAASTFHWMPFASGFVSFDGVAATVPLHLIEAIRRHVDEINAKGAEFIASLKRGDVVVVHGGPFAGYEAIFDTRLSGSERVRVLLKPFEPTLLHARITASLEKKSLRDQHRKLLQTFATEEVAEELMKNGFSLGGQNMDATIIFADIRSFTTYTEQHEAADVVELLNSYFATMFKPISSHSGIVNQIIGDTVNLAARIESHTKVVGCPILIDAETRASLPESVQVEPLGEFTFKGKTISVQIYSVRTE